LDSVALKVADGQSVLLSRILCTEGGQEVVYFGMRDSYNKLAKNISWQTYFGYITKGIKAGEHVASSPVSILVS
jgi:hypothetical protein